MHKFASALTSEKSDPVHDGCYDEAGGDDDNLEE